MTIRNFYCNGFFGRRYDLENAEIIAESDYTITIRTEEGEVITAAFDDTETKKKMKEEWTN